MAEYYRRLLLGQAPRGPSPAYLDFVYSERAVAARPGSEERPDRKGLPAPFFGEGIGARTAIREAVPLDRTFWEMLTVGARSLQTGPYQILIGVLAILIGRFTGQESVTIGLPVLNRKGKKFKRTIGMFTRVAPIQIDLARDLSFSRLIASIRGAQRRANRPATRAGSANDRRHYKLAFSYDVHEKAICFPGCRTRMRALFPGVLTIPLNVYLGKYGRSAPVEIFFDYRPDDMPKYLVDEWRARFEMITRRLIFNAGEPLSRLDLFFPGERETMLGHWNGQPLPRWDLATLFEDRARRHPRRTALVFGSDRWSYSRLLREVSQTSATLKKAHGPRPEDRVGLMMDPSPRLIAMVLAVIRAGALWVPLDRAWPEPRLQRILDDADCRILIADPPPARDLGRSWLDGSRSWADKDLDSSPRLEPDQGAYMMFTSGSSGFPKGVLVSHRAVANNVLYAKAYAARADSSAKPRRTVLSTPLVFDPAVQQIFGSLLHGHVLHIPERPPGQSGFYEAVARCRPETLNGTPAFLAEYAEQGRLRDARPGLKRMLVGGETVPRRLIDRLLHPSSGFRGELFNLYGPSECCIDVTGQRIQSGDEGARIGSPGANIRLYVLDRELAPLPVGAVGEICIAGVSLARGYWRRPAQTARRFTPSLLSATGI